MRAARLVVGSGMWRRRALTAVALGAALAGCVDFLAVQGGGSVPVVLTVVVVGEDSVFVAIGTSGPGTQRGAEPGAVLTLETAAGTVPLVEVAAGALDCGVPEGYSCYVAVPPERIGQGESVRLAGTLASGAVVRGSTVTPSPPPIQVGVHGPGGSVRWVDRPGGAPALTLGEGRGRVAVRDSVVMATWWEGERSGVCPVLVENPVAGLDLRLITLFFSSRVLLADPVCAGVRVAGWDSLSATLSFLGYDAQATDWLETGGGIWPEEAGRYGLDGALGMFGSAAPATFGIHITARHAAP